MLGTQNSGWAIRRRFASIRYTPYLIWFMSVLPKFQLLPSSKQTWILKLLNIAIFWCFAYWKLCYSLFFNAFQYPCLFARWCWNSTRPAMKPNTLILSAKLCLTALGQNLRQTTAQGLLQRPRISTERVWFKLMGELTYCIQNDTHETI